MADTELPVLRLGHQNGEITTIGFGFPPDHDDLAVLRDANHDELNDHSKAQRTWFLSMPDEHKPYWTHVHQADHMWLNHGEAPPVWVSCPGHSALEQAVAEHFSGRGHQVRVGEPEEA